MNPLPTELGLIRHAMTLWNEKKRIQGQKDSPLSESGREMASLWGEKLLPFGWTRILTSTLGRSMETAAIINETLGLPINHDSRLQEQDWGDWAGLTLPELKKLHKSAVQTQEKAGWDFCPPGGESRLEVLHRTDAALNEASRHWPGETILVVCHEGIVKCCLYHLSQRLFLPDEPKLLKNYHLHLLRSGQNGLTLKSVNHLQLSA